MEEIKSIEKYGESVFESIKHIDEEGNEYWLARELQIVLGYKEWRLFSAVINKAKASCEESVNRSVNHFGVDPKMVVTGDSARKIIDYRLSRYACYLIVQNGNPRKKVIALGQTYFAVQTRKQELSEAEYLSLDEDEKRLYKRNKTKKANYSLNQVAGKAGVKNFDRFHNAGYKGLYGETANDIFRRKNLRYREDILDNMGSEELSINEFRIIITEQKLKKEEIEGENNANKAHNTVGKIVRQAIRKAGGVMPEELPTPKKSIKEIEKRREKDEKNN